MKQLEEVVTNLNKNVNWQAILASCNNSLQNFETQKVEG